MKDRLKFIENGLKSATEVGAQNFRTVNSLINAVDMPDNVKKELQSAMEDLRLAMSQKSMVKVQAVKDRLQPLQKAYAKIVEADKAKNKNK